VTRYLRHIQEERQSHRIVDKVPSVSAKAPLPTEH